MTDAGNREPSISVRFLERALDPSWWCTHLLTDGPGDEPWGRNREDDSLERFLFPVLDAQPIARVREERPPPCSGTWKAVRRPGAPRSRPLTSPMATFSARTASPPPPS